MANIDRYFVLTGLAYAGIGLLLGNVMGASGDHSQLPTHAHIMLLGFVFMSLAGVLYRLWPAMQRGVLPLVHFWLHQAGAGVLFIGLWLLYGGMPEETVGPVLGVAGIVVLGSWGLFAFLFLTRSAPAAVPAGTPAQ